MSLTLSPATTRAEVVLADAGSLKTFYHIAGLLNESLKIKFRHKEDEMDSINWEFKYQGQSLTLHYNIFNGIILYPTSTGVTSMRVQKAIDQLVTALKIKMPDPI